MSSDQTIRNGAQKFQEALDSMRATPNQDISEALDIGLRGLQVRAIGNLEEEIGKLARSNAEIAHQLRRIANHYTGEHQE